jgi:arylformamidase
MTFSIDIGNAIDLTHTVENGMPVYIGDPVPKISRFKRLAKDGVNVSVLKLGSHTGTHVDAPIHFVRGGQAVDELSVESFVGEAAVLDFSGKQAGSAITASDLEGHSDEVEKGSIVLLYTGFSKKWKDLRARRKFTYLSGDAAQWLAEREVKAVGIDYLSVEKFGAKTPIAHVTLLSRGIPIIESLNQNLSRLVGRKVLFVCLPIKIGECDGAPARAMAYPLTGSGQSN